MFLSGFLISLSLESSFLLFPGEASPGRLQITHSLKFIVLLNLTKLFLFVSGLSTGKLLSSLSLRSQTLSFSEFSTALCLGLLLLFALLLDFKTELLFLLFLLLDNSEVILLLVIFLCSTDFLAICLFVVLCINGSVVLVLATTTFAFGLAIHQFVILIHLTGK